MPIERRKDFPADLRAAAARHQRAAGWWHRLACAMGSGPLVPRDAHMEAAFALQMRASIIEGVTSASAH